jgi:PASTA domain
MARHRCRAIGSVLLTMGLAALLSSCGGPAYTTGPPGSLPPGSGGSSRSPGGGGSSGTPVTSGAATATSTTVPNVDSKPVPEAEQSLQQVGLGLGAQKQEPNLEVEPGSVIATNPAVGTQVRTGFHVNLLVSAGAPHCPNCLYIPRKFPMLNVVGENLQQAITTLAESGLTLGTYSFQESSVSKGTVIQSTPSAGAPTSVLDEVVLVLSSGLAGSPSTPSPSSSPSTPSPSSSSPSTPSPSTPSPGNTTSAPG